MGKTLTGDNALKAWVADLQNKPHPLFPLAKTLAGHKDTPKALGLAARIGYRDPLRFIQAVQWAVDEAKADAERRPKKEETKALEDVSEHARKLGSALQGAQALDRSAPLADLDGGGVIVVWTRAGASTEGATGLPVVTLPDLLSALVKVCELKIAKGRPRQFGRADKHTTPECIAFVRLLDACLRLNVGKSSPACIALVVCVLYPRTHMIAKDVERLLRAKL